MCRLLVRTSVTRWRLLSSSHVARLRIAASSCKLVYNGDCSWACASLCACGWVCLWKPTLSDNESNLRSWMDLACLWCKAILPSETSIQLLKHIRRWANVRDMLSLQHLPYYWLICSSQFCHVTNYLGMQGMCGHKQFGIWEVSKITVVDSNVVNHWLMTGAINIPTILINDRCL